MVKMFKKGDQVAAFPLLSCGKQCLACRTGKLPAYVTLFGSYIGIDVDGGICESTYVDEDVLFKTYWRIKISDQSAVTVEPLAVSS